MPLLMAAIMAAYLNYATSKHDIIIMQPALQELAAFVEAL